uniref:Uncharacterized protein n=1 Tax=Romanomermis culicivorax TaxID=13658 RepID=A0A915KGI4_ROMCU
NNINNSHFVVLAFGVSNRVVVLWLPLSLEVIYRVTTTCYRDGPVWAEEVQPGSAKPVLLCVFGSAY